MRFEDKSILVFGPLMYVSDRYGNAAESLTEPRGLFWHDTRVVRSLQLLINGEVPNLLTSDENSADRRRFGFTLTDLESAGLFQHPRHFVFITRTQLLDGTGFVDALDIRSFTPRRYPLDITLRWGVDFADVSEIRHPGLKPVIHRRIATERSARAMEFTYRGMDDRLYSCLIRSSHRHARLSRQGCRLRTTLPPRDFLHFSLHVLPAARPLTGGPRKTLNRVSRSAPDSPQPSLAARLRRQDRARAKWLESGATVLATDPAFNRRIRHAFDDLRCLELPVGSLAIPSAGVPFFHAPFGRDMIITAFSLLPFRPKVAEHVLRFLARWQGRSRNVYREEEPGKILHELRVGERARTGRVPHAPYYGSSDVTLLFVTLLHEYYLWSGDVSFVREMEPSLSAALRWAEECGDSDGDGWIEYDAIPGRGLVHKGWKDSRDSLVDDRGRPPLPPLRLVEIQGYWTDALQRASQLFGTLRLDRQARLCSHQARDLRSRIEKRFWMPSRGAFALALDGRSRPIRSVTSNAGHLLFSGAVTPSAARRIRDRLFEKDMHSGWGIRTLSSLDPSYHPLHYHRGTVWPHDNAVIAFGLSRYGMTSDAESLLHGLGGAFARFPNRRWPELFAGFSRAEQPAPVPYPLACAPQAWSAAALFLLLRATLGLFANAPEGLIELRNPRIPTGVHRLELKNLRVGTTVGDLLLTPDRQEWTVRSVGRSAQRGPSVTLRVSY